jgi:hypothetical protein
LNKFLLHELELHGLELHGLELHELELRELELHELELRELELREDHDGHGDHLHDDVHEEGRDVRSDEEELNELLGLHEDDEGQEQQRF